MPSIEIDIHESPYANNDNKLLPVLTPPCGGACCSCCCCSSSSFVFPEAIILKVANEKTYSKLTFTQQVLLIYGVSSLVHIGLGVLFAILGAETLFSVLAIVGFFGALLINPIYVGVINRKQYHNKNGIGFYVFLLALPGIAVYFFLFAEFIL